MYFDPPVQVCYNYVRVFLGYVCCIGDIIEISDHHSSHLTRCSSSSSSSPHKTTDLVEPRVIPCEDGGYLIDPSTISTSPIRSFTRLQDMDPHQRAGFQNQFQKSKGRRSRGERSTVTQSKGGWPDQFDELLGMVG